MPGYGEFDAQAWHHAVWNGPLGLSRHELWSSLEAILFPVAALVLFVLLASTVAGVSRLGRQRRYPPSHAARAGSTAAAGRVPLAPHVLASEAERDHALRAISRAVGEGRLDLEAADVRIEAVLRCRHRDELAELVRDLPPDSSPRPTRSTASSRLRSVLLASALACVLAAVVAQAAAGLWELWPVAVAACSVWAVRPRR